MVKSLSAKWENQVQSLGLEYLLEKGRQPTPLFLPEESHGQRSLANYSPWGHKELDVMSDLIQYDWCSNKRGNSGKQRDTRGVRAKRATMMKKQQEGSMF